MEKSSHRWGPWEGHEFDSWGSHTWNFYRWCEDCNAVDAAPSRSLCDLREEAHQVAMIKSQRLAGWRG